MTFVVGSPCVSCKDTHCVEVCPVDCFYEGPDMLVISPDECIDCALCEPACPVDAIWSDTDLPEEQKPFLDLNAKLWDSPGYENITDAKEPMASESPHSLENAIKLIEAEADKL